jgi:hypothetical protein
MKNITVTVSDRAYRQARVWAGQHDSSLSRIVQYLISTLPNISRAARIPRPENRPIRARDTLSRNSFARKERAFNRRRMSLNVYILGGGSPCKHIKSMHLSSRSPTPPWGEEFSASETVGLSNTIRFNRLIRENPRKYSGCKSVKPWRPWQLHHSK